VEVEVKEKNEEEIHTRKTDVFEDRIDMYKFAMDTRNQLKMNPDYVLASLSEKDKKYIIEMAVNARLVGSVLILMMAKCERLGIHLTKEQKDKIEGHITALQLTFTDRSEGIVTLERNKKDNPLLNMIFQTQEDEDRLKEEQETKGMMEGFKKLFKAKKEEKE